MTIADALRAQVIDVALMPNGMETLRNLSALFVPAFAVGGLANFGRIVCSTVVGERIVRNVRTRLFSSFMQQDIAFFDKHRTGDLVSRLTADAMLVGDTMTDKLAGGLRNALQGSIALSYMLYLSPHLTGIMLAVVAPMALGVATYGRMLRHLKTNTQETLGASSAQAEEKLGNIRTVRAFGRGADETAAYSGTVHDLYRLAVRLGLLSGTFFSVFPFMGNLSLLTVMYNGATLVMDGSMTVGDLTTFMTYTVWLGVAFRGSITFYSDVMKALGVGQRLFSLIDRKPEMRIGTLKPDRVSGHIRFDDVTFSYPTRPGVQVLRGLNLDIAPGETVAIVGESGSGKSTCTALLSQFYEPSAGSVLLDGNDVRDLDPMWLAAHVGLVPQEPVLFTGTVADNIRYGCEDATDEDVRVAARVANAHNFISAFPDGYATLVGERGLSVSGGQKQRLALARAILKDPELLILDEATSALDGESERLVQRAIVNMLHSRTANDRPRTAIIVAHRLSTIRNATRIVVLENGSVLEQGTFDELMQGDTKFRTMFQDDAQ